MTSALTSAVAGWAHLYNNATAVSVAVTYAHFAGMLVGGGSAVVADRDAFLVKPEVFAASPAPFAQVHRWVVAGLVVMFASGILMLLADLDTYLASAAFWIKMGLVALLLGNGYGRVRAEAALSRGGAAAAAAGKWLRRTSGASLVLWLAVLLASAVLTTS